MFIADFLYKEQKQTKDDWINKSTREIIREVHFYLVLVVVVVVFVHQSVENEEL